MILAAAIVAFVQVYLGTVEAPDYGPPVRVTVRESATPGVDCGVPYAGACATLDGDTCTLYLPTRESEAWTTAYTLLLPDQVAGHELAHCWLGSWHV